MTDHVFTGHYASTYQEGRDGTGRHLGEVEPGEIRDMNPDALPDHQWREATDEDRERWAAVLAEREAPAPQVVVTGSPAVRGSNVETFQLAGTPADEGAGSPQDETPAGPQPAAPAVIPQ